VGKYPSWNCRQLERRLREIGCELLRTAGSHRPFRPDRLITFAWHPGDEPRGIIADIIEEPRPQIRDITSALFPLVKTSAISIQPRMNSDEHGFNFGALPGFFQGSNDENIDRGRSDGWIGPLGGTGTGRRANPNPQG
jgi:predicted RNA binding protein YcfA (HicA-like mRNA interferase family)